MAEFALYDGPLTDNARWVEVAAREGDVVVATPPKSGTTWTQSICALLISGDPGVDAKNSVVSPWVDIRLREIGPMLEELEGQTRKRYLKTHTPLDGVPVREDCIYFGVYRHPLDVHFSMRRHVENMQLDALDRFYPEDISESFEMFLGLGADGDGIDMPGLAGIVHHYRCARALAARENVHLFHYADMSRDLAGAMGRMAAAMGILHDAERMAALVEAATFDNMKANADRFAPSAGLGVWASDAAFFDSGSSGKWSGRLSEAELAAYDAAMETLLPEGARRWLEWGSAPER